MFNRAEIDFLSEKITKIIQNNILSRTTKLLRLRTWLNNEKSKSTSNKDFNLRPFIYFANISNLKKLHCEILPLEINFKTYIIYYHFNLNSSNKVFFSRKTFIITIHVRLFFNCGKIHLHPFSCPKKSYLVAFFNLSLSISLHESIGLMVR